MRARHLRLLALALSLVALVACNRSPKTLEVGDRSVPAERLVATVRTLCEVESLADDARNEEARQLFFDEAHDSLHLIAAAVEEVNRPASARLLEVKNSVEEDLRGPSGAERDPHLVEATGRLKSETRSALERLGIVSEDCN